MRREPQEFELAYALKKEALGPHVIPRWGWDEREQRAIMEEKWRAKTFFRIVSGGEMVGTIAIDVESDHVRLGEFYIAARFQGQGIGSRVLEPVLRDADARRLPVRLECLKWNPAFSLYRRHGFRVVRETDVHYFMERAPGG
ncbi:MAG TPA: GNAT family N-acetyltransferase [Usitatibacter sp.]|nr:GNAT family N-acetyltransferase [Usitatibacter sp.]